jgi:hypothetical protein
MSATSGAKTWGGKEVYNELGSLYAKVSGASGTAFLSTASYDTCGGVRWMWRIDGISGWFREGGYMSYTEQEAFNKGIAYCKEQGYEIINN